MRTLGGEVARGRWGRSATGRGLSEWLAVHDIAVLGCCTAPDLPDEPDGPNFRFSGIRIPVQGGSLWFLAYSVALLHPGGPWCLYMYETTNEPLPLAVCAAQDLRAREGDHVDAGGPAS